MSSNLIIFESKNKNDLKHEVELLTQKYHTSDPILVIRSLIKNNVYYWSMREACMFIGPLYGIPWQTLRGAIDRGEMEYMRKPNPNLSRDLKWDLLTELVKDSFGKGARHFFKALGSQSVSPIKQKEHELFLKKAQECISSQQIPWFKGDAEDLWNELLPKTSNGLLRGKKANHAGMFIVRKQASKGAMRKYILKNGLHKNSNFPTLKFECDMCKIQGHDENEHSNWTHFETNEQLLIGGGKSLIYSKGVVKLVLDHINGDGKDDRIENLRWLCYNCDPFTCHFARHKHLGPKKVKDIVSVELAKLQSENFDKCAICARTHWNTVIDDQSLIFLIPLESDHIDGDHSNNADDNVREICRQCHANTPTFSSNNPKYKK